MTLKELKTIGISGTITVDNKSIINDIDKTIEYLETNTNYVIFKNGGYSYSDIVLNMIGDICDNSNFEKIYIPNLKSKFQKGDILNLTYEECITYFKWLPTAERLAVGTLKVQIDKSYFINILKQTKLYLISKKQD